MSTPIKEKNKRLLSDRRKCPTPMLSRYTFFGGRRKTIRREKEKKKHLFVDLYSTRLLIAVVSLLILSCLDAYLTLTLIAKGSVVEANPIMAFFLDYGIMPFTIIKFVITSLCLILLCLLKNAYITRICLPIAIKIYLFVVAYEFYLFVKI
jgi:hypothetical protein